MLEFEYSTPEKIYFCTKCIIEKIHSFLVVQFHSLQDLF